ncbi:MAG: phage minor head protein [Acidobacteriota bacterium]|nr:phage minor head protein [Acidobacteriota bacterium]
MSSFFDDEEETARFDAVYLPFLAAGLVYGIKLGLGRLAVEDVFTAQVKAALRRKSHEHAALAVGTTKDQLKALLETAIVEGQSAKQLAKAIRDTFDFNDTVRSLRIARTELTGTINDGTFRTLAQEGHTLKQWNTVVDGRERETHHEANGQTVGMHQLFHVGASYAQYPGDDSLPVSELANCRCTLTAAGLDDRRIDALGRSFLSGHGKLEHKFMLSLRKAFLAQRGRILSHL